MKKNILIGLSVLAFVMAALAGYLYLDNENTKRTMTYLSFMDAVNENRVESVIFDENGNTFKAVLKNEPDHSYTVPNPKTENFIEYLLTNNITVNYGQSNLQTKILPSLLLLFIMGGVFFLLRKKGDAPLMTDSNKRAGNKEKITLNNIAGNTEAKQMVEDIIEFIKNPSKYAQVGARMPKGLLLYGPPGTGKTMMAKAIAGEAGVPFYAMSGSDFVQMYVGVGASRIRNLFHKAKKSEKAVIFIDEIDAIGKKRARVNSASNDERDQTLNALLTEMSGFHENKGIVVIGATNRLDTLDEALLRPGRFDRQIEIGLPDVNARKKILSLYAGKKPLSDDVDLDSLAKSTVYFSGAMLENLLNEAAINAANEKQSVINNKHIEKAFYTVIAGAPIQDRSFISERDRKITAYHEAGHALVTKLLLPEHFISRVTIIPSVKGAGGFNLSIPKDTIFQTQKQIRANIQMLLGGRIAEELNFGKDEITTGASNDIQKASSMLVDYIDKYGMDQDMGLFSTAVLTDGYDSELVNKCRNLMNLLYDETKKLIEDNQELLKQIAEELLEKETLNGNDIDQIFLKHPDSQS